jgi:hypothetical protein
MKQGYISINHRYDKWVFDEADLILKPGIELDVFHENTWQKAVIEFNDNYCGLVLYMFEIDEYKPIRSDVLVRKDVID